MAKVVSESANGYVLDRYDERLNNGGDYVLIFLILQNKQFIALHIYLSLKQRTCLQIKNNNFRH